MIPALRLRERLTPLAPFAIPTILVGITCLRWMFIAGGHDWGWDYETAYRGYYGQRYGIDYFSTVGPLSYEILAKLLTLTGPRLLPIQVFWYGCWIGILVGATLLARLVEKNNFVLAAGLSLAIVVSPPHAIYLHSYNFIGIALAVYTLLALGHHLRNEGSAPLYISGAFSALAVFTKQNLGLTLIPLVVLSLVLCTWIKNRNVKLCLVRLFPYLTGLTIVGTLCATYFARHVGLAELGNLMFKDAVQAKGGLAHLLWLFLPRISVSTAVVTMACRLANYGLTLTVYLAVFSIARRRRLTSAVVPSPPPSRNDLAFAAVCFSALVFATWIFADETRFLILSYRRTSLATFLYPIQAGFFVYLVVQFAALAFYYEKDRRETSGDLNVVYPIGIAIVVLHLVNRAHNPTYGHLSAAMLVPFLFALFWQIGLWRSKTYRFVFAAAVLVMNLNVLPTQGYGKMSAVPLAEYEYLRVHTETANREFRFYSKLRVLIENHRTAWLTSGGPHSIAKGIPVRNVSNLYTDQYSPRIDERIQSEWLASPPEFLVFAYGAYLPRQTWLGGSDLRRWIVKNYDEVTRVGGFSVRRIKVAAQRTP